MNSESPQTNERKFSVPIIDETNNGIIHLLWPCDWERLKKYLLEKFSIVEGGGRRWGGYTYFSPELDKKNGCPTAVIALSEWHSDIKDPNYETNTATLAHECFHAAEWMLKQKGYIQPTFESDEEWTSSEVGAYQIQWIMSRALKNMIKES